MKNSLKARYFGDLHLEFTDHQPSVIESIGEDLVVLAGDISTGTLGIEWAKSAFLGRPVVYVLGNHEFFGQDWHALVPEARKACEGSNVHMLENDQIEIEGLRVLGCSLWTDFHCFGEAYAKAAEQAASDLMVDYKAIRNSRNADGMLLPKDTYLRCRASHDWLEAEIGRSDQPTLVVTHHTPSLATEHPSFRGEITGAAFYNRFDHLIRSPVRAWIHGHTHYSCEARVNGIPVVTNQSGYPREYRGTFAWDRVLQIDLASLAESQ